MKIYLVGGAVRDKLLGLPVKEKDYVVVGASAAEMLQKGFRQVGKEFPVFLHPQTQAEYALARLERKTQPGYKGFETDTSASVTLEDDLARRDLTINAMAFDEEQNLLIDPYHGQQDIAAKNLRHVSSAFAEDPVRILRIGRFLARYAHLGFKVHPETLQLMRGMVAAGEVNALVAERVWKEFERALNEPNPEKFFEVLIECQAQPILFPTINEQSLKALNFACALSIDPMVRFAVLFYPLFPHGAAQVKEKIAAFCQRYRTPFAYQQLAKLVTLHYEEAIHATQLTSDVLVNLFTKLDIYRKPSRFDAFLIACEAIALSTQQTFAASLLVGCAQAARSVLVQPFLTRGLSGQDLAQSMYNERVIAVQNFRNSQ